MTAEKLEAGFIIRCPVEKVKRISDDWTFGKYIFIRLHPNSFQGGGRNLLRNVWNGGTAIKGLPCPCPQLGNKRWVYLPNMAFWVLEGRGCNGNKTCCEPNKMKTGEYKRRKEDDHHSGPLSLVFKWEFCPLLRISLPVFTSGSPIASVGWLIWKTRQLFVDTLF